MSRFEVIIVGAGPAGLSAALILGRCRRRVLVLDAGQPRNARSHALHGFLTRDGVEPAELLRMAREQLQPYDSVELRRAEVTQACRIADGFEVTLSDGTRLTARKVLLATGIVDQLPEIEGIKALYGRSVFHCPYCDGWEVRDQPLAIYGRGKPAHAFARELTVWSKDLVLCTDGPAELGVVDWEHLSQLGIPIQTERIAHLEGMDGMLERIVFTNGDVLPRRALFFITGQHQASPLAAQLGCRFTLDGDVETGRFEATNIPGLYVAGDVSRSVQLAIVAAAEGAEAAFAINSALVHEDVA